MTLLRCTPGHSASKIWRVGPLGRPACQGFDAGWLFYVEQYAVNSIRDIASLLYAAQSTTDRFVIRGIPVPGLDLTQPHYRRKLARTGKFTRQTEPPTFIDQPNGPQWGMFDFDGFELHFDFNTQTPEVAVQQVLSRLPACFQNVTVFWQLGSSAGMTNPRALSLHLWFWFDRPLTDEELARWTETFDVEVDATVFRTVQPHYFCTPRFEGLVDPLPRRCGLIVGSREDVPVPAIPTKPRRVFASASGGTTHYETDMRLLGDGPGGLGFYRPILQGVWDYVKSGRRDFDWLKADIRRQAAIAPVKHSRSPDYLERIVSDEELDRFIEGALLKTAPPEQITRDQIEHEAKNLRRSRNPDKQKLGRGLDQIAKGEMPNGGASAIVQIAKTIAGPNVDANSIAKLFAQSLQITPDAPTVEQLQTVIEGEQANARTQKIAADLGRDAEARRRIREAFTDGRDWPYTEAELEAMAALAGCTRDDAQHRWIIQFRKQFYIQFMGAYQGPIAAEELIPRAMTFLAPASSAGVIVEGLTPAELMASYGSPATNVIASMIDKFSRFDASAHTLIEAACPVRDLVPTFDPDVDHWLRLLAGPKFDKLCDWIAASTRLDRPCPALFLRGPTGNGKSLLICGLARQWTEGKPTDLEAAMGTFNSALLDCPLVFGDERIPRDARGNPRTEELRELITRVEHPLRRKHIAESSVRGSIRVALAANNLNMLNIPGELTNQDIAAIGERFLYIDLDDDDFRAAQFLISKGGGEFALKLVQEDRIAKHALWLRDTRSIIVGGRWAVPGNCGELLQAMRTGAGLRWPICHWLVAWLMDTAKAPAASLFPSKAAAAAAVRVSEGKVYAHPAKIRAGWGEHLDGEFAPSLQKLQKAFAELCVSGDAGRKQFRLKGTEEKVWMREIALENLLTWAAMFDGPTEAELRAAIEHHSLVTRERKRIEETN